MGGFLTFAADCVADYTEGADLDLDTGLGFDLGIVDGYQVFVLCLDICSHLNDSHVDGSHLNDFRLNGSRSYDFH